MGSDPERRAARGVASPVLSNIYLHKLDVFVETVLIPEYTRGRLRARNPESVSYTHLDVYKRQSKS